MCLKLISYNGFMECITKKLNKDKNRGMERACFGKVLAKNLGKVCKGIEYT